MSERPDGDCLETDAGIDPLAGEHPPVTATQTAEVEAAEAEAAGPPAADATSGGRTGGTGRAPGSDSDWEDPIVYDARLDAEQDAIPDLDVREARQRPERKAKGPEPSDGGRQPDPLDDVIGEMPDLPEAPPSDPV